MQLGIIRTRRKLRKISRTMLHSVRVMSSFLGLFPEKTDTMADKNKVVVKTD